MQKQKKQEPAPRFSVTTTYTDDQAPGYHAGAYEAVVAWLGEQKNLATADMAPVTVVPAGPDH